MYSAGNRIQSRQAEETKIVQVGNSSFKVEIMIRNEICVHPKIILKTSCFRIGPASSYRLVLHSQGRRDHACISCIQQSKPKEIDRCQFFLLEGDPHKAEATDTNKAIADPRSIGVKQTAQAFVWKAT